MDFNVNRSIFLGDIPIGKSFFFRIENSLLISNKDDIIEIVSFFDNLEDDLKSYCIFKGETFFDKKKNKELYSYYIKKKSSNSFPKFDANKTELSSYPTSNIGLAPRNCVPENGSPDYGFDLNYKEDIWNNNITKLYEDTKKSQWNSSVDIDWNEIPDYDKDMEFAIVQIMTYLTENEFSALYVPSKFISKVSPYFYEIPLFLSSLMNDEARHIDAFIRRANINGMGVQYSSIITQNSLYTLYKEDNYLKSSFLLHIMGEGTFVDLLNFLEKYTQDEATKKLLRLVRIDESRHVAYGMNHVKQVLKYNPKKVSILKEAVFKRKEYLDELNGESTLLIESMAFLAGGGTSYNQYRRGMELIGELKEKMHTNRVQRLVDIGIDEDLAVDISKRHTPNFM
ncbi:ferritin-like domain-containing protein [Brachyspira alvinipulli]|uniref:ferritin-like domain-containing protein n=1 Tax=Brachyspira alvinipulli TaxID=84379 RepID=UPI00262C29FA|nr:ferritin-like domain-containing protein [uncultured Brachyspira sp.]